MLSFCVAENPTSITTHKAVSEHQIPSANHLQVKPFQRFKVETFGTISEIAQKNLGSPGARSLYEFGFIQPFKVNCTHLQTPEQF